MGPFCSKRKILKPSMKHPRSFVIWHFLQLSNPFSIRAPTPTNLCSNHTKLLGFLKHTTYFCALCFVLAVSSASKAPSILPLTLLGNCYPPFGPRPPTSLSVNACLFQAKGGTFRVFACSQVFCSPTSFSLTGLQGTNWIPRVWSVKQTNKNQTD